MKKILFLGRFTPPIHGAAVMNDTYFNSLQNDSNFLVRRIKINYSQSLDHLGEVSFKKFFYTIYSYFLLIKELIFFRPDIIYFEIAPKGTAFIRDSIFILICKLFRKKIVFHFHAKGLRNFANKNKVLLGFCKYIFRNAEVILLSNLLYSDVEGIISKNQINIVPNGIKSEISDEYFKTMLSKREKNKKTVLLFLSNMIESKGPLEVLNICAELQKEKLDFECVFVGKFQDKTFEETFFRQLKSLNLEKKCKYLGPKYGAEKFKILERTNYLLFPTSYPEETFGLVIIEAFSYGIPVLSYDNASIKEIISNNYLGFVARQSDWKSLFENLSGRLGLKENALKIREEFKRKYTLSRSEAKLKEVLK